MPEHPSTASVAEVESEGSTRSAAVSSASADALGGALEIRVVAGPARTPVAQAEVFVLDASTPHFSSFGELVPPDLGLETLGRRSATDQEGRARVAPPTGPAIVSARSSAGFARSEIDAGEPGPVVLVLEPDPPVRVRVVDRGGAPAAGVPVVLRDGMWLADLAQATTGADGTAELFLHGRGRSRAHSRTVVGLALILPEPVEAPVDLEQVSPLPLVLVLPETGTVEVELVDEHGEPWSKETSVWIGRSALPQTDTWSIDWSQRAVEQHVTGGRALFERVGLGLELRALADPEERKESSLIIQGPATPGQRVEARLEVGAAMPLLLGRILDAERRPIAAASLSLSARFGSGGMSVSCATDSRGRFRKALDAGDLQISGASELQLVARRNDRQAYHGSIAETHLVLGENDLGDVVLARSPLVASGTVVDQDDEPVRGASVTFLRDATAGPGYSGTKLDQVKTDALGRFAWSAQVETDTIGVRVEAPGFAGPDTRIVPSGTEDLRFVLVHGGWIVGRALFTTEVWPDFELWRDGRVVNATSSMDGPWEEEKKFRLGPVPAGTYSLACGYPWSTERVWIEELAVVAGSENIDPRLDPLDLRAFLPIVGLTIVDREGASVPDPAIYLPHAGTGELVNAHPGRDGERWLVQGGPLPLRIRVEAPGFQAQTLEGVDSDRKVVLQRGIPVRLEFVGALPELPAGWMLRGELTRQSFGATPGVPDRRARLREPAFALADGKSELWLAEPGGYLFTFLVSREGPGWGMDRSSFWDEPQPVLEIRDDGTLQGFELRAPSEATVKEMREHVAKSEARSAGLFSR